MAQTNNRKSVQLDVDVSRIKDDYARRAIEQLHQLVLALVGTGLDTEGVVAARLGLVSGASDDNPIPFMVRPVLRSLAPNTGGQDHYVRVKVPGRILGICGYAQVQGSATGWRGISRDAAVNTVYISQALEDTVLFQNTDGSHSNAFRAVIFYVKPVLDREVGVTSA